MYLYVVPHHLLLLVAYCSVVSLAATAITYKIHTNSNGSHVCSIDQPTTAVTLTTRKTAVQCGVLCTSSSVCELYQFKADLTRCELFNNMPRNFQATNNCKAYVRMPRGCPEGWVSDGYSCYKLIPRMYVGWQQSRDYCSAIDVQQKQARLVVIDREEKQRLIHRLLFTAYSGIIGYSDLALRKSASQSSTWDAYWVASHAVDGLGSTCSATRDTTQQPWWAVDLENPSFVYGVNLTNRGDCCADRMNNFIVALTNNVSSSSFPSNYTLCGQWPGIAPSGATMFVGCASDFAPFRYAAITLGTPTIMNFCEVEVYGIRGLIWLAGRRQSFNDPRSSFVWSPFSASAIPMSYSNWNITGPSTVGDGNCVAMDATTGIWINAPCNSTNVYTFCELLP